MTSSDDVTGRHEEDLIEAPVSYGAHLVGLPKDHKEASVSARLVQIMEHWDVWIELLPDSGGRKNRTALLVRMGSLIHSNFRRVNEPPLDLVCYRLTRVEDSRNRIGFPKSLFSIDIDPSIDLYDVPEIIPREFVAALMQAVRLKQSQVDILIDAVRQSLQLDEDQKDCMIEGIRAFKLRDPET